MNRLYLFFILICLVFVACTNKPDTKSKEASTTNNTKPKQNETEIKWLGIEALEESVKKAPKDILIMVYATWCEESKKYHNTTYKNADIISYLNKNYYTALVNAEEEETINFRGKQYAIHPNTGHNEIVYELQARSIPSLVFLDKDFNIQGHKNGFTDVALLDELLFQYKNNY